MMHGTTNIKYLQGVYPLNSALYNNACLLVNSTQMLVHQIVQFYKNFSNIVYLLVVLTLN